MLDASAIEAICARYEEVRPSFVTAAAQIGILVKTALERGGIKHMVTHRAKAISSLKRKLTLEAEEYGPEDFLDVLSPPLKDLAGCRVLLYLPQDRDAAVNAVESFFAGCTDTWPSRTRDQNHGYRAHHLHVQLGLCSSTDRDGLESWVLNIPCEIQICTLTAHVWNELEHDIIYKIPDGRPDDAQKEMLKSLNSELRLCEQTVDRLMSRTASRAQENSRPIRGNEELRYVLSQRWNSPVEGDLSGLLAILEGLVLNLTPAAIDTMLKERPGEGREQAMLDRLDQFRALGTVGEILVALTPGLGPANVKDLSEAVEPRTPMMKFAARVAEDTERGHAWGES